MNKSKIESLIPLLGTKVAGYRGDWVLASCPFAPWKHDDGKDAHPSFGVKSSKTKKSIYKCFSCGQGGDLQDLILDLGIELKKDSTGGYHLGKALQLVASEFDNLEFDPNIPEYGENKKPNEFVEYPDSWLQSFQKVNYKSGVGDYLKNRGVSEELALEFDLRYDPFQKRVCFPFRDFKGRLAGIQGRALEPSNPLRYYFYDYAKHKNMHVWLGEHHVNFDKPLVLVEGPFDYASVYRVYKNVAASFSAGINKDKVRRMSDASCIITFYDYGHGGDQARKRIHEVMQGVTPVIDLVPPDDDLDAGAMPEDMVREYLNEHVKL